MLLIVAFGILILEQIGFPIMFVITSSVANNDEVCGMCGMSWILVPPFFLRRQAERG